MGKGKKGDKITRPSEVKPGRKRGFGGQSRSPNHPFRTISSVTSQKTKANNQDSENKPNPCVPSVTWEGDSPSEKSLSWQAVSRAALAEGDVRVHGLKKKGGTRSRGLGISCRRHRSSQASHRAIRVAAGTGGLRRGLASETRVGGISQHRCTSE